MVQIRVNRDLALSVIFGLVLNLTGTASAQHSLKEQLVPAIVSNGFETDRRDMGRPVWLIAGALGVDPQIFRNAFSGVRPARGEEPSPDRVHQNKDALLRILRPYGITNDRLDEVSDFYRYQPGTDRLWTHSPAVIEAIVVNGAVKKFRIVKHGNGYNSSPTVTVPGIKGHFLALTSNARSFETNGAVTSVTPIKSVAVLTK